MATREQQNTERNGERREEGGLSSKTHEVAEQAKQAALERVDAVRQTTQSARDQAAERVRKVGAAVRKVGEHLRVEDQHYIADKATDASQRLETFANYLNNTEISGLLRDTGMLARKSPSVFFGSAFLVGLATGRLLRGGSAMAAGGSSQERFESSPRPEMPSARATTGSSASNVRSPQPARGGVSQ
jgi:hypothetical protein